MTRAFGYGRVSSEMQMDGFSLAAQERAIRDYCAARGIDLTEMFTDEGVSAYTDVIAKRPAFARMLDAATRRQTDMVIVHELSRWARNVGVQGRSLDILRAARVTFVSIQDNIVISDRASDMTPEGELMLTMMAGIHRFHSANLGRHVRKGQKERAVQGLPPGGAPFGYRHIGGEIVVDRAAAAGVLDAFERRAAGQSYQVISDAMNAAGHTSRRGNPFTGFAVKDMIACRFYAGVIRYMGDEYPGKHEAIVPEALWQAANARRSGRRIISARQVHGAFGGRVRCSRCLRPMWTGLLDSGRPVYRERHGKPCDTEGRSLAASVVDWQMGDVFRAMQLPREALEAALGEVRAALSAPDDVERLQDARKRLARAYTVPGALTDDEYERRMADLDARIRAAVGTSAPPIEEAWALVQNLPALWDGADERQRQELLGAAVEEVFVDIKARVVAGFRPVPGLDALLSAAARAIPGNCSGSSVVLVETRGIISLVQPLHRGGIWAVTRAA